MTITKAMLEAVAGPETQQNAPGKTFSTTGDGFDLGAVLRDSGIVIHRGHTTSYGATVYEVDCLTSADHDDGACFMQFPNGAVAYTCRHDRCRGKGWQDVKGVLTLPERPRATLRASKASQSPQGSTGRDVLVRAAVVVRMSDVESKPVDWLWGGWLPRRMLTILGGYSGDGKSTTTLALAATFSRGGMLPDGTRAPRIGTLILAAEDDAEYAIRPRLDLHHADASRVLQLKATKHEDGREAWLDLRTDTDVMRDVIAREGIGLVLIDPLSSYMPKADRNDEGSVRDALAPLQALMEDTGVAVLGIMHIGKGDAGRKAFQRLLGSTAFTALARSVWMIHDLPDDEQPAGVEDDPSLKRKVLGVVKANYAIPPQSLAFSRPLDGPVIWHGPSPVSIEAAIAGTAGEKKLDEAQDFLRDFLKGGARHSSEAVAAAKANDITERTLKRAKAALKVVAFKEPGKKSGGWLWRLPAATDDGVPDPDSEGGQTADVGTLPENGPNGEGGQESLYRQFGTLHGFPNGSIDEDDELMPTGTDDAGEWEYVL